MSKTNFELRQPVWVDYTTESKMELYLDSCLSFIADKYSLTMIVVDLWRIKEIRLRPTTDGIAITSTRRVGTTFRSVPTVIEEHMIRELKLWLRDIGRKDLMPIPGEDLFLRSMKNILNS